MPRGIPNPKPAAEHAEHAAAPDAPAGAEAAIDHAIEGAADAGVKAAEAVVHEAVKLVRMVRDHVEGQPSTADVHPAEVAHMAEHGWRIAEPEHDGE